MREGAQCASPYRAYPDISIAWSRLRTYLGADFDDSLTDYDMCCAFVEAEFAEYGPREFYRRSRGYLYELTHFHFMPHKQSFFAMVTDFAHAKGLRSLGDVGCGIGLDAQALIGLGYELTLYDFESPSLQYAGWRLRHELGYPAQTRSLDELGTRRHDLVYAVNVLEHVAEPSSMIEQLFETAEHVCVDLFPHDASAWNGTDMHYPLDHWSMLPVFSRLGELLQLAVNGDTVATLWRRRGR